MPVVNLEQYKAMLEAASKGHYAYPAVNVSSMETASAALMAFANAKSDGIIQVSVGGGEHASGNAVKNSALGAIAIADYVRFIADQYNVFVALHTDHCKAEKLESFVLPLIEETERRRACGRPNVFNSHMFDGSVLPLKENLKIAKGLLARCAKSEIILEVEAGVVGGEEDGVNNSDVPNSKLYTTPGDMVEVYRELSAVEGATYMVAATFGNVHGVYKPGNVKLNPKILRDGQKELKSVYGEDTKFYLVFHGGSGSEKEDIAETLDYGVVKMNIDTDTQYAFTRPVADHMFKNYDGVLKIESEVGNKKVYDPRSYLRAGEAGMAQRMIEACNDLQSAGKTLLR
ncbi:MAG: class II fructose-bisphosphate aldolase [Clostridia bacterium]|nr:class II fructose-bisphosphate aldolase [Clostridia bacterium]